MTAVKLATTGPLLVVASMSNSIVTTRVADLEVARLAGGHEVARVVAGDGLADGVVGGGGDLGADTLDPELAATPVPFDDLGLAP